MNALQKLTKRIGVTLGALMVSLYVGAGQVMAQATTVFPVDQSGFDDIEATVLAWAAPVFAILLALMAYKVVKRVVR